MKHNKHAIVLGDRSDIAQALMPMMYEDGWTLDGWNRNAPIPFADWDLVLVTLGQVKPVGMWWDIPEAEWESAIESNVLLPVRMLRYLWTHRKPGARVCFMAGSNPNTVMDGYSAYNAGKMCLLKVVEQLDHESQDAVIFALGPGVTNTKIHNATLEAKWPNPRLERALKDGSFTSNADIYHCLTWCLSQPKEVVGGRNIVVSDQYGPGLIVRLKLNQSMFKLRRAE